MTPFRDSSVTWFARALIWLVFPVTMSLAITHQSLWIDEGYTIWFASHRGIGSFFSALIGSPGAPGDPQMVFYLLYIWAWIKLFGIKEVALRAANIPFAMLFIGTMIWASRRLLRQPNLWIFFYLSPFFWFYLNDARPYVALMAFSGTAIVALLAYLTNPEEYKLFAPWCCLIALLLAWGTHILGAFLFPSMIVLTVAGAAGDLNVRRNFLRDWYRPALWCLPGFIALAIFYVWVSANGVNRGPRRPGLSNLVYVLYEFLGFGGLGPPRNEIRETPRGVIFASYWPWLVPGAVVLLGLVFCLLRTRPSKIVWRFAVSLLVGGAAAVAISEVENFQALGRHMAALFPLFLLTPLLWVNPSFSPSNTRRGTTAVLVALGLIWGISDARLTLVSKYGKDSYREASSIASERARLDGAKILWAADPHAAHYYGILVMKDQRTVEIGNDDGLDWPVRTEAIDARNWSASEATGYFDSSTSPCLLVLSKPDLFDTKGGWNALIQRRRPTELARLIAFVVYEWRPQATTIGSPSKKDEASDSLP